MLNITRFSRIGRETYSILKTFGDWERTTRENNVDWLAPHVLGFAGSIVTLMSLNGKPSISDTALAEMQVSVLARTSGASRHHIGQELHRLSLTADPSFNDGVKGGHQFVEALQRWRRNHQDSDVLEISDETACAELITIWREHVSACAG